jgi:hypothetical protein
MEYWSDGLDLGGDRSLILVLLQIFLKENIVM